MGIKKLTATFEIVTPIFMGGANPNEEAELRPPSIKGALRWWYRAMNLGTPADEAKLFGGAKEGEGQSKVLIIVEDDPELGTMERLWKNKPNLGYLGFGAIKNVNRAEKEERDLRGKYVKPIRSYFTENGVFTLSFRFNPRTTDEEFGTFNKALIGLLLFGGIGSKTRRGFGSFRLTDIETDSIGFLSFMESVSLRKLFSELKTGDEIPKRTSFSANSRCLKIDRNEWIDWEKPTVWIADKLNQFRSYKSKEVRYENDHDVALNFLTNAYKMANDRIERAVFGLPHNYFFQDSRNSQGLYPEMLDVEAGIFNEGKIDNITRRNSPLLITINKGEDGKYYVIFLFLRAVFLPDGAKLALKPNSKTRIQQWERKWESQYNNKDEIPFVPMELPGDIYKPINDFMDYTKSIKDVKVEEY